MVNYGKIDDKVRRNRNGLALIMHTLSDLQAGYFRRGVCTQLPEAENKIARNRSAKIALSIYFWVVFSL